MRDRPVRRLGESFGPGAPDGGRGAWDVRGRCRDLPASGPPCEGVDAVLDELTRVPAPRAPAVDRVVVEEEGHPVGALVEPDLRWQPLCAPRRGELAVAALAVAGATAVGLRWAARPQAVRTITMGHGGWVSFRGASPPAPRQGGRRPWWAVLLRAQRLRG